MSNIQSRLGRRAVLGAAATMALARPSIAQSAPIELKVSHFLPPNHTFQKLMLEWSGELEKQSGGKLTLKLYPAAQLGPPPRQFDLARNGVADIAIGLTGSTPGRYPVTEIVSEAFVVPKAGDSSAAMSRRLTELAPEYLLAEYPGMKLLWAMVTAPLKFHTTKVAIHGPDDFKGLRIRYAGEQFAEQLKALGAVPLAVPPPETQDALAKGIVDGATFPYEGAQSFDIGTVVKHSLEPGLSTATFVTVMNPKRFETLPAELAAMITAGSGPAMAERFGAGLDQAEKTGRDYMLAKGVEINTLAPDQLAKVKALVSPLMETRLAALEKDGKPARKFLAAYVA